jgi:pimeloyl-ACP methyl ester carboxylesterase
LSSSSDGDYTQFVMTTPYEALRVLATQQVTVAPNLEHLEVYTLGGLLTLLWHGRGDEDAVVVCCGGAMGGLLGPARGLYHDLGVALVEHGIATVRVGWRKPNDLEACSHDMLAALELAVRRGARTAVTVGHSFGGAAAVRAGVLADEIVAGVVTLATQSAGCEVADRLAGRPVLCIHGTNDEILPPMCSELVAGMSGGEVLLLPGTGHLLAEVGDELRDRLGSWIPQTLGKTSS